MKMKINIRKWLYKLRYRKIYEKLPPEFQDIHPVKLAVLMYVRSIENLISVEIEKFQTKNKKKIKKKNV